MMGTGQFYPPGAPPGGNFQHHPPNGSYSPNQFQGIVINIAIKLS